MLDVIHVFCSSVLAATTSSSSVVVVPEAADSSNTHVERQLNQQLVVSEQAVRLEEFEDLEESSSTIAVADMVSYDDNDEGIDDAPIAQPTTAQAEYTHSFTPPLPPLLPIIPHTISVDTEEAPTSSESGLSSPTAEMSTPLPLPDSPLDQPSLHQLCLEQLNGIDWSSVAVKLLLVIEAISLAATAEALQQQQYHELTYDRHLSARAVVPVVVDEVYAKALQLCLSIISSLVTIDADIILAGILSYSQLAELLLLALMQPSTGRLRTIVSDGILTLCATALPSLSDNVSDVCPAMEITALLLPQFSIAQHYEATCKEYFSLMSKLITSTNQSLLRVDVRVISIQLTTSIKERASSESSDESNDYLLQGYMVLLHSIFNAVSPEMKTQLIQEVEESHHLINELLFSCLFPTYSRNNNNNNGELLQDTDFIIPPPKCQSPESRECAFQLLLVFIEANSTYYNRIVQFLSHFYDFNDFNVTYNQRRILSSDLLVVRSKTGYAGIDNPGCICYMNSCIQQLFMMSDFRQNILQIPENELDPNLHPSENILFQLQLLFANLLESDAASVNPHSFCNALKDFDGQPTDVRVQQDASEFLTKIFQRVEEKIMGTSRENVLKNCFGGTFMNQLSADGGYFSERPEPFYFISVEVGNGKNSLEDSMHEFVKGESAEYSWVLKEQENIGEKMSKSLPTIKKALIKNLPTNLIFHLRRFDFDYQTFQIAKKNDRFEFPLELNMSPFTLNAQDDSSKNSSIGTEDDCSACLYELTGVVVHTGTTESGHYYSFCKQSNPNDSKRTNWLELNDSIVREFDINNLDEEAFGGPISKNTIDITSTNVAGSNNTVNANMKIKNAFMLFYTKRTNHNVVPASNTTASLNRNLKGLVYANNLRFWKQKSIFNDDFYDFMNSFLHLSLSNKTIVDNTISMDIFALLFYYFFVVLVQADEKSYLTMWSNKISHILRYNVTYSEWVLQKFLQSENSRILEILVLKESSHVDVMRVFVSAIESVQYCSSSNSCALTTAQQTSMKLLTQGFAYILLQRADQVGSTDKSQLVSTLCPLAYYFYPLFSLSVLYPDVAKLFIQKQILLNLLSLFLHDKAYSATDSNTVNCNSSKDEFLVASSLQIGLVAAIAAMISIVHQIAYIDKSEKPSSVCFDELALLLSSRAFPSAIVYQLKAVYGVKFNGDRQGVIQQLFIIVNFGVYDCQEGSKICVGRIVEYLKKSDGMDLKDGFRFAKLLMQVEDNFTLWRIDYVMKALLEVMQTNMKFILATETSTDMLLRILKKLPKVREWAVDTANSARFLWLDNWLDKRRLGASPVGAVSAKPLPPGQKTPRPLFMTANKRAELISNNGFSSPAIMLHVLRKYMSKYEVQEPYYDSDDEPIDLLHQKVEVKWAYNSYYTGTVEVYHSYANEMEPSSEVEGQHVVSYDDGDVKTHLLTAKVWRFADTNTP